MPDGQLDLPGLEESPHVRINIPDADLILYRNFIKPADSDLLLARLLSDPIPWKQDEIKMYDKTIPVPRLASWHGDAGCSYTYSGIRSEPEPWTPTLQEIRSLVEDQVGLRFNSVLVNHYRNGSDSVAWHSDDEAELGRNPTIASVSLGATRIFQLKHTRFAARRTEIELTHGSLLVMRGETQHHWMHQVPKTKRPCGSRINLTFRIIK